MKKVLIVGNGQRGQTLAKYLNRQDYDVFDISNDSTFSKISEINFQDYSEMIIATSENSKFEYIEIALNNAINALVEKPLLFDEELLNSWQIRANKTGILIRTAYSHRYEAHIEKAKELIEEGYLGKIYNISGFYGNGTAENIKNSSWRDSKFAVVIDLIPHLLDLMNYFIGPSEFAKMSLVNKSFENNGSDFCILRGEANNIFFEFVVTYLSWKNRFNFEITGSEALINLKGLEKWNNPYLVAYSRKHPPSEPNQLELDFTDNNSHLLNQWLTFKEDISNSKFTDFNSDLEISRILKSLLGEQVFNTYLK